MIFATLISYIKDRLAKRARYLQLASEINALSYRELVDLKADRGDMLRSAYAEVYGA